MNKKSKNENFKEKFRGISVIIPCFNVEKYIINCLDSLIKQLDNYNYEIILIDDCSKDNTKGAIKEYISNLNENHITLLENEENIGAGASRNKAVNISKYDLISFIDADDYVDDNFFFEMINKMQENDADIVACDFNIIYEETGKSEISKTCEFVPSKFNLINNGLAASPCNKLIKKEYLEKYPFAEGIMNEDVPCILSIIANCKKVNYTDKTRYNYIQHKGSVQNSKLSLKKLDIITAYKMFEERIRSNYEYYDFTTAVMFHQIICMILYVPSKDENFFNRVKFFNAFHKKIKGLNIRQNVYYWKFIDSLGLKAKIYYKSMMKFICTGFSVLASLEISLYHLYSKLRSQKSVIKKNISLDDIVKATIKNQKIKSAKTLSVAIPNYNYDRFLYQRIYSILNQNYRINELIILDDCSSDDSRETIDDLVSKLSPYISIQKVYNKTNSGSTFKQWRKSFEIAKSDYLWIAEADDYCNNKMVSKIMAKMEQDDKITIGYVDTAFINKDGNIILKSIKPEIDILHTKHWDSDFVNDGLDEIKNYEYLNCTIANVSSVIFKIQDYSEIFDEIINYRQTGDYLFYVYVISKGKICFINEPLNYYRVHGNNVTSTTKKQLHLDELKRVHEYVRKHFGLNEVQEENILNRYNFLEDVWHLNEEKRIKNSYEYKMGYNDSLDKIIQTLKANNINEKVIEEIKNGTKE